MILSTILSFLGGATFRMLWGEVAAWMQRKQEHGQETDRMRLQADLDDRRHAREQEAIKTQAALQVQVIRVQGEQAIGEVEANAWLEAVTATGRATGVRWVDAWNAGIRPACATWALAMLTCEAIGWLTMGEATAAVCSAALGLFLADRTLAKRGK